MPNQARRRTQVAKGEVCKTFIQRFDSARRLQAHRSLLRVHAVVVPSLVAFAMGLHTTPASARAAEVRSGIIQKTDALARTVSVMDGSARRVYEVPASAVLVIAKRAATLEQFTPGMKVQARSSSVGKRGARLYDLVEAGSWQWLQRVRRDVTGGKVLALDEKGLTVEDALDRGVMAYRITPKTLVAIGHGEADRKSIAIGQTVFVAPRLLPNGATMATAIADTKSEALRLRERTRPTVTGAIAAWDVSTRKLTLNTRAGDTRQVLLHGDCLIRRDGTDLAATVLRKGMTVTVHVRRSGAGVEECHRVTVKSGFAGAARR